MPNLDLRPKRHLSSFRVIAIGTWVTTKDPSVYGSLEVPADEVLSYVRAFREHTGLRLTLTHVMAKVMAKVFEAMPDANAILRFNRIYLRSEIALSFQVAMSDPETGQIDLSALTLRRPDTKSLREIVEEFEAVAAKIKAGKDLEKEETRRTFQRAPTWLVGRLLDVVSFLTYGLNLDMSWAGIPRDLFGSAMITNVGSLGLKTAYVPLVPYSRVPLIIAVGAVEKKPVVAEDGTVQVGHTLGLHATFDHRILDGAHAATMARTVQEVFADPWTHLDPVPRE